MATRLIDSQNTLGGKLLYPFICPCSEQSRLDRGALLAGVVKLWEAHFDDLFQVVMERDAAIVERDALRVERVTQALTADRFCAAVAEADTLRAEVVSRDEQLSLSACRAATAEARVAELEAAAKSFLDDHGVRERGSVN